jgi:predicted  nucleic acid-binding Zn-ribbon protein
MKIPADFLHEKNYEGTRLLEITDETVLKLRGEIAKFTPIAKPHLDEMEKHGKVVDPYYQQIHNHQQEIEKLRKEMAPAKALFDAEHQKLEAIHQQAEAIKVKMTPLVNKILEGQLSEFERPAQLIDKEGKVYVEIVDELEEKVKSLRASKKK